MNFCSKLKLSRYKQVDGVVNFYKQAVAWISKNLYRLNFSDFMFRLFCFSIYNLQKCYLEKKNATVTNSNM